MFTGLIEEVGEVVAIRPSGDGARITVRSPLVVEDVEHGASIAVSGVCLTVVGWGGDWFDADVMRETLDVTTIGAREPGDRVNVERALRADARLGGHIVQGHVDGVATLLGRTPGERSDEVRFALPPELSRYVVEKGSICVDGVSLTVAATDGNTFTVALIPTTLADTTLGIRVAGDTVNIEVDVVAKYVERLTVAYRHVAGEAAGIQ